VTLSGLQSDHRHEAILRPEGTRMLWA
jgi:hypothetical protein